MEEEILKNLTQINRHLKEMRRSLAVVSNAAYVVILMLPALAFIAVETRGVPSFFVAAIYCAMVIGVSIMGSKALWKDLDP